MRAVRSTPRDFPESCPLLKNPNAAHEWVACCSKHFFWRAKLVVGEDSLAEDALQDTWPKVLRNVSSFQGGPTACQWVGTVVVNSAKDIRRKRLRSREVAIDEAMLDDLAKDPETRATDQQMMRVLREMITRLPEPYRQVIEMRFEHELSTGETAKQLDISRSNVASRLHRGLRMLRSRFSARIIRKRLS